MGGKSSEVESTQTSEPPAWAQPLLERGAADALRLYNQGKGFSTYMGPTQAPLSDQTLGAMNSIMALTGGQGGISNKSINSLIPKISMDDFHQRKGAPAQGGPVSPDAGGRWSGAFGLGQHNASDLVWDDQPNSMIKNPNYRGKKLW